MTRIPGSTALAAQGCGRAVRDNGNLLAYLDRAAIEAAYSAAPGNEIASGKFLSRESSAALAANAMGLFFAEPELLPPLPGSEDLDWPASKVTAETIVRFPWAGGRHPCLDALIETGGAMIGLESKRYEPYRPKAKPGLSEAYWRPVWGERMAGYQRIRDDLRDGTLGFEHLDAAQLVKHALGLLSAAKRSDRRAILIYLYAEPDAWPDERPILKARIERHRQEISSFAERVRNDEVGFVAVSYGMLLATWSRTPDERVRRHAAAVRDHFAIESPEGLISDLEPLWRSDDPNSSTTAAMLAERT